MNTWSVSRKGADDIWYPQHNKWTGLPVYQGDIEVIYLTPSDAQKQDDSFEWSSPSATYRFVKD